MNRTIGKFTVTSKFNPEFKYEGYSKQCEIVFRDYMTWCANKKAPKVIQNEYDRVVKDDVNKALKPSEVFSLKIEPLTVEEFEHLANKKIGTPKNITISSKEFTPPDLKAMMSKVLGGQPVINIIDGRGMTPIELRDAMDKNNSAAIVNTVGKTPLEVGTEVHQAIETGKTVAINDAVSEQSATANPPTPPAMPTETVQKPKINYKALYGEYIAGGKVDVICKKNKITKSDFYKNIKQYQ